MNLPPGIYTPEEAAAAMEAAARAEADEREALKQQVATLERQVALLMQSAVAKGDVTVNQVRSALGLPQFAPPEGT